MKLADFHFDLPDELIARYPLANRSDSRLLELNASNGQVNHLGFSEITDLLHENDLVIFNDTRVIPARLFGTKESGGKVELFLERFISEHKALVHIKASNKTSPETLIQIADDFAVKVLDRHDRLYEIESEQPLLPQFEQHGHMPLPPYIDRPDEDSDRSRYQTVYAQNDGAVAAPTAGLHFTEELLEKMTEKGIEHAFVTLHVGAGTFQPVRVDNISEHRMHSEWFDISPETVTKVEAAKARGGRVVAVGTTSVRTLESASQSGQLKSMRGETDIFIYPGYQFQCIDAMITNFHLPESTLIMLVSAFAGKENVLTAYQEAIANQYRFFSYGDAMFIHHSGNRS